MGERGPQNDSAMLCVGVCVCLRLETCLPSASVTLLCSESEAK